MDDSNFWERVQCPYCYSHFEIAPTSTASTYPCDFCKEPLSLGSLRNPNLKANAIDVSRASSAASSENLRCHSTAYLYVDCESTLQVASGTVVKFGDRILMATTAHTRPTDRLSISVVGKNCPTVDDPNFCVDRRVESQTEDVAIFELDADAAYKLGLEAIGIERICDLHCGKCYKSYLFGYPAGYVSNEYPQRGEKGVTALCYTCEPIASDRWEAIQSQADFTPCPLKHVIFEFTTDVIHWNKPSHLPSELKDPSGTSGGGIWQRERPILENALWTAEDLKLFAIQSSHLQRSGFLVAIQIIHWLKLVADTYPDLREELFERFPRLKTF